MRELTATAQAKDEGRLIKYFVRSDMRISYSQFSSLKTRQGLLLNGVPVHANAVLREGDTVTVMIEDTQPDRVEKIPPETGEVNIVYRDSDILIIDKSAPLACQYSAKQPSGTLENRLAAMFGEDYVFRPLNRLDKGTSGLMAAAQNAHACQILQKQLHTDAFVREYLAVAEGHMEGEGWIDAPIAKIDEDSVKRVIDPAGGRRAVTHYRVESAGKDSSIVRLRLETGRTHQIRVHLASAGHPIIGDFLYGHEDERLPGRFALHSTFLSLIHPVTGERLSFTSALPDELSQLHEQH